MNFDACTGGVILAGAEATEIPDWFRRRLRDVDAALVVYFNPFRGVFCIDRCVKGQDCLSRDHASCEKTNVMLFEHIGEAALEKLKSMDAWTHSGGKDEAALLRFRRRHEIAKEEHDAKTDAEMRGEFRAKMLEDRPQLTEALTLIQRHDVARPHK
jgi:hypothetical protein